MNPSCLNAGNHKAEVAFTGGAQEDVWSMIAALDVLLARFTVNVKLSQRALPVCLLTDIGFGPLASKAGPRFVVAPEWLLDSFGKFEASSFLISETGVRVDPSHRRHSESCQWIRVLAQSPRPAWHTSPGHPIHCACHGGPRRMYWALLMVLTRKSSPERQADTAAQSAGRRS